jgi:nucleoside 2-deoxyribosyltransferase
MPKVYVSGALTSVEDLSAAKAFYEAIGALCEEMGLQAYVPHLHTDPVRHPGITPREVFEVDKHHVVESNLVIAYIGIPSLGVGMELAYAETHNIPIILLYERGRVISRIARGVPTIAAEIPFEDYEDALNRLREALPRWRDGGGQG